MNGDDLPDRVTTGNATDLIVYLNQGDGFSDTGISWFTPTADPDWPQYVRNVNDDGVYQDIIDMNGDGLPDRVTNGGSDYLKVFLNNGYGFESTPILWNCPTIHGSNYINGYNSSGLFQIIMDINGDGLQDRVENGVGNSLIVYLNNGSGFETAGISWVLPEAGDQYVMGISNYYQTSAMLIDMNGDGLVDRVRPGSSTYLNVYLSSGSLPDHLTEVKNEYGGKTTIQYKPSSSVEYENVYLPFVYQTVESVAVNDYNGNVTQKDFEYKGGRWDPETRNLWGFDYVKQLNSNESVEETWYLQDPFYYGRKDREVLRDFDEGPVLSEIDYEWDKSFIDIQNTIAFVKLGQKRTELDGNGAYFSQEDYTYDNADPDKFIITTQITGTGADPITKDVKYENIGDWLWRLKEETVYGKKTVESTGLVRKTLYNYDPATGNLSSKELWLEDGTNPSTGYTYYGNGNLLTETDPEGNITTYYYDEQETGTFPITIEYPQTENAIHVAEKQYDYRFGKVKKERTRQKDETGQWVENNWTEYVYDGFGRLETTLYPDGGRSDKEYVDDAFHRYMITRTKENSTEPTIDTTEYYDGLGRIFKTTSTGIKDGASRQIITQKEYHSNNNYQVDIGPYYDGAYYKMPRTVTTYDDLGRVIESETTDSVHGQIVTMFEPDGFSVTKTDPDICLKKETKDHLGRIVGVTEYADEGELSTVYAYNAAGDLLEVTDHPGNKTKIFYDTLGRKKRMEDPDMGVWVYDYDQNGNLIYQKDQKDQTGQETELGYDELNRLRTKTFSTSDPAVEYAYDLGVFGIGSLYSVSNGLVAATTEAYDLMGRAKRVVKNITGAPQTPYATLYDYDLAGKTKKITYPGGYFINYGYHPGTGLLSTVTGSDSMQFAAFTSYLASAKTAHIDYGNGAQTTYAYDPQSARLTGILTLDSGQTPLFNKSYAYSPAGDITQITDLRANSAYGYEHDALHRLTAETNLYGATATTASILSFEYTGGSVHGVDRITDEIYDAQYDLGYDGNGNQTSGVDLTNPAQPVERTIYYNAGNMPTRIDMGGVQASAITYDGENARAVKATTGSTTYYVNPYFEIENGVETRYIFGNSTRIARIKGTDTLYFHKDHLGSTAVLTGSNGLEIAPPTEYLPYGMDRNGSGQTASAYKFTDQEQEQETGLYNYDARLYDPVTALFVSPDPYFSANLAAHIYYSGLLAGNSNSADFPASYKTDEFALYFSDPQRLNRYAYVLNNPVNFIDPEGLEIRLYSSDAFGISGYNHAFVYSTETGRFKGTAGSSWITRSDGRGDLNSPYVVAPLPFGMSENDFMNRIESASGWNNWIWVPYLNDCHSDLENAFDQAGVPYPDVPNERIDIDDDIANAFNNIMFQLNNPGNFYLLFGRY